MENSFGIRLVHLFTDFESLGEIENQLLPTLLATVPTSEQLPRSIRVPLRCYSVPTRTQIFVGVFCMSSFNELAMC